MQHMWRDEGCCRYEDGAIRRLDQRDEAPDSMQDLHKSAPTTSAVTETWNRSGSRIRRTHREGQDLRSMHTCCICFHYVEEDSKSKSVLPKISARSGLAGKNPPGPIWGLPSQFFAWAGKCKKSEKKNAYFPWWANGPYSTTLGHLW